MNKSTSLVERKKAKGSGRECSVVKDSDVRPSQIVTTADDPLNDLTEKIFSIRTLLSKINAESPQIDYESPKQERTKSSSNIYKFARSPLRKDLSEEKASKQPKNAAKKAVPV